MSALAFFALLLSLWITFWTLKNGTHLREIYTKQAIIQTTQSDIQSLQQQLNSQQQSIESATQLANQAGPAIINEMAAIQLRSGNPALKDLLQKHGITPMRAESMPSPAPQPKSTRIRD